MAFSSEDTVLLLRTHRGQAFLPSVVRRALLSDGVTLAISDFTRSHEEKMQSTFGLQPVGVISIAEFARRKGMAEPDFEAVSCRFGFAAPMPRKDSKWETLGKLAKDQVACAADGAFLNYTLLDKVWTLPDLKDGQRIDVAQAAKESARATSVPQAASSDAAATQSTRDSSEEALSAGGASSAAAAAEKEDEEEPLPEGWSMHIDEASGCAFYCNAETSQWERPSGRDPADAEAGVAGDVASRQLEATQPLSGPSLPPGWQAVQQDDAGPYYYADAETQASQWSPPAAYVHGDWARQVDYEGCLAATAAAPRAYWYSSVFGIRFYEDDVGDWRRLVDHAGRTYWSNAVSGERFFEVFDAATRLATAVPLSQQVGA